jgi:hypothetical protein
MVRKRPAPEKTLAVLERDAGRPEAVPKAAQYHVPDRSKLSGIVDAVIFCTKIETGVSFKDPVHGSVR